MGKLYYSIGEVSERTGLKPHILRFWESRFPMLRPKKSRSGNRMYRDREIQIVSLIKQMLYEEKYTIEGARQKLQTDKEFVERRLKDLAEQKMDTEVLREIRDGLRELLGLLSPENVGKG